MTFFARREIRWRASKFADSIGLNPKRPCRDSAAQQRLRVEYWPVEKLKLYERNPRNSDKVVDQIRASIREYGFAVPILATSAVIDGHLRLKGAIAERMQEVPVVPCGGWTDPQVKAFRLMVNRSVTWAHWDPELLAQEIAELPKNPVTKPGDVRLCGKHRALCGDSTAADAVSRACAGTEPFLMACDPPYGVPYNPIWREAAGSGQQRQTGRVANDDQVDWTAAYKLFSGDVIYV